MRTREEIEKTRAENSYVPDIETIVEILLDIRDLLQSPSISKRKDET
jgi:hypothetical protein